MTVTVNWTTADGTAVQPDDYTTDSGTLNFTGNEKSKIISVTTIDDSFDEPDQENFAIELSGETPANVVYFNQNASVTVNDNDALPTLSFGTIPTITEGDAAYATVQIPITLNNPSNREVTVDFAVTAVSAALTHDYTVVTSPNKLTFPVQNQQQMIEFHIVGDIFYEDNETFTIALSNATNADIDPTAATGETVTINDNDSPPVFTISETASINEGATAPDNTAKFVVTQTPGSGKAVSINYTFDDVNAIAGSDYSITITNPTPADDGNTGILTFPASDNPAATVTMDLEFTVLPDVLDEHDETFTVTLANPTPSTDGTIQTTNNNHIGTATITDDDAMPELTIADASGVEGSTDADKLLKFTPTLSAVSGPGSCGDVCNSTKRSVPG